MPARRMRRLSEEQASSCETATSPPSACRCRCGGAFHGAARGIALEDLPLDDPHTRRVRIPPGQESAAGLVEQLADQAVRGASARRELALLVRALLAEREEKDLPPALRLAVARARLELLE